MKTITISIQVPDGVNVEVNNGGGDRPFVARPDPDYPTGACSICGSEQWRLIKAGTSKRTGKPFNSFYVCGTEGCDGKPGQDGLPF